MTHPYSKAPRLMQPGGFFCGDTGILCRGLQGTLGRGSGFEYRAPACGPAPAGGHGRGL